MKNRINNHWRILLYPLNILKIGQYGNRLKVYLALPMWTILLGNQIVEKGIFLFTEEWMDLGTGHQHLLKSKRDIDREIDIMCFHLDEHTIYKVVLSKTIIHKK